VRWNERQKKKKGEEWECGEEIGKSMRLSRVPNCKTSSSFVGLFRLQYEFCSFCLSTFYKTYGSCFTKSRVFWFVLLIHMFYGYIVS
jgi:hypothetical protein